MDEVLLEQAAAEGGCCCRFYQWETPTLSLGYFQQYADREQHPASRECPLVRRASGGGAILHDRELTYSFVAPAAHALAVRRATLYTAIHQILIDVFAEFGIRASLSGESASPRPEQHPFLCFLRHTPGDVLVDGVKVVGSAQRRLQKAVLQHGSLLLERSPFAPELAGLADLTHSPLPETANSAVRVGANISQRLDFSWEIKPLTDEERRRAGVLTDTLYGSDRWNRLRKR